MRGQGLAILGLRLAAGGTVRRVCAYGKKTPRKCPYTAPCAYVPSHVMRSRALLVFVLYCFMSFDRF